jgi:hypothetical protein
VLFDSNFALIRSLDKLKQFSGLKQTLRPARRSSVSGSSLAKAINAPMRRVASDCPRVASGNPTAAPARRAMISRRFIAALTPK